MRGDPIPRGDNPDEAGFTAFLADIMRERGVDSALMEARAFVRREIDDAITDLSVPTYARSSGVDENLLFDAIAGLLPDEYDGSLNDIRWPEEPPQIVIDTIRDAEVQHLILVRLVEMTIEYNIAEVSNNTEAIDLIQKDKIRTMAELVSRCGVSIDGPWAALLDHFIENPPITEDAVLAEVPTVVEEHTIRQRYIGELLNILEQTGSDQQKARPILRLAEDAASAETEELQQAFVDEALRDFGVPHDVFRLLITITKEFRQERHRLIG